MTLMKVLSVLFFCLVATSAVWAESVDELSFMTEEFPPFNYEKNGQLEGIAIDVLELMLKNMGSKLSRCDVILLPWARAYRAVLNKEDTVLFSMTRTETRENLFKWVGPVAQARVAVMALKEKKIAVDSFDDLKKYRIGVIREDIGEQSLIQGGMAKEDLDAASSIIASIKKLKKGRIDAWAYDQTVAMWAIKNYGFNPEEFETVHVLKVAGLYYAFNKNTPDALITQFQGALDELKKPGSGGNSPYEEILSRYSNVLGGADQAIPRK